MIVSLIAAVDSKNGIGLNGVMPWGRIKEDMEFFRSMTIGHPVIMGRITFESIGSKPLPNRLNIVISSHTDNKLLDKYNNLCYSSSLEDTLSSLKCNQIFVIGGESIYKKALNYADEIYLTHINKDYNCDRFFPVINNNIFEAKKLKSFVYDGADVNIIKYIRR